MANKRLGTVLETDRGHGPKDGFARGQGQELPRVLECSIWAFLDIEELGELAQAARGLRDRVYAFLGQLQLVDLSRPMTRHLGRGLPAVVRERCTSLRALRLEPPLGAAMQARLCALVAVRRAQFTGLIASRALDLNDRLCDELLRCPQLEYFSCSPPLLNNAGVRLGGLRNLRCLVLGGGDGQEMTTSKWFALLAASRDAGVERPLFGAADRTKAACCRWPARAARRSGTLFW